MATPTTPRATGTSRPFGLRDPAYQGFALLWMGFTVAPILFGLDKFFHVMVDWPIYLWDPVAANLPWTAETIMMGVGVVEILAGVLVALAPRIGGYVVAAWLGAIVVNLLLVGGYLDIALRDFGLLIGALALARLATQFRPRGLFSRAGTATHEVAPPPHQPVAEERWSRQPVG